MDNFSLQDVELIAKLRKCGDYEAIEAFLGQARLLIDEVGIVGKPHNFRCSLPENNMNIQFTNKTILKLDFSQKQPRFFYALSPQKVAQLLQKYTTAKKEKNATLEAMKNGVEPQVIALPYLNLDFENDIKNDWLKIAKEAFVSYTVGIREKDFSPELYKFIIDTRYQKAILDFAQSDSPIPTHFLPTMPTHTTHFNQILFGPPGTGKTYNSINHALSIVESTPLPAYETEDRTEIKKRFDEWIEKEQIQLVTFHQSFGYEDFVEGIKPMVKQDGSGVGYVLEDGIFKRMCIEAKYALYHAFKQKQKRTQPATDNKVDFDELWLAFLSNINIPTVFKTKTDANIELIHINSSNNITVRPEAGIRTYIVSKNRIRTLYNTFKSINDIKNVIEDLRKTIGGSNDSAYWAVFNELKAFEKTFEKQQAEIGDDETDEEIAQLNYEDKKSLVSDFDFQQISPDILAEAKKYVLIIDEINRGNVAQIFGELITLIEPSKRAGKEEELKIILPYSKSMFSVPQNLYLIGTMNTADRSVEALDTALRRRFTFIEMPPKTELLGKIGTLEVGKMLQTINQRIEILLDKDHAIGHSYFLGVETLEDLQRVFSLHILPLLQEYFFGDVGKIGLVLGESFVRKKQNIALAKFEAYDKYAQKDLQKREVFELTPATMWNFEL